MWSQDVSDAERRKRLPLEQTFIRRRSSNLTCNQTVMSGGISIRFVEFFAAPSYRFNRVRCRLVESLLAAKLMRCFLDRVEEPVFGSVSGLLPIGV
jgi:hypothetical protein